jgi:hypothetical protein
LTRGRLADVQAIFKFYGPKKVKEALLAVRDLDTKTLHFWAFYFKTPIEQFKCYEQRHLNQQLWPH